MILAGAVARFVHRARRVRHGGSAPSAPARRQPRGIPELARGAAPHYNRECRQGGGGHCAGAAGNHHGRGPDMSFISEFKQFAIRGNVVDLAVAVIIGGAFGKIVDSLVKDIVMPVVGRLVGGVDFRHLYFNLGSGDYETLEAAEKAGAPLVKYGAFINTTIDFIIIVLAIFLAIKAINRLKRAEPPPPPPPPPEPEDIKLLREIRDALKRG
jgi:large conductance mechanosensitive channel